MQNYLYWVFSQWRAAFREPLFRWKMLLAPGCFFLYSAITQRLGNYIETRPGLQLEDKLLQLFPSMDFSMGIFLLLYTCLALVVLTHIDRPRVILRIIEMHFAVAVVRQLCICLVALNPPAGLIVLRDVFLENTVYPSHAPLTHDLFFSGHVASIWLYFLCAERRWMKTYLLAATAWMSFMILCMRVHYTYDVYGALLITSLLFYAPARIRAILQTRLVRQSGK